MSDFKADYATQQEGEAIELFFADHPEINYQAARDVIVDYIHPAKVTLDTLEKAYVLLGNKLNAKSPRQLQREATEEAKRQAAELAQQRANLENAIIQNRKRTPPEIRNLKAELKRMTFAEVLQRAENIVNEKQWRAKPIEELRAEVKQDHPRYTLPPVLENITRESILRASPSQLKNWFQKYGSDAVTRRLQGID